MSVENLVSSLLNCFPYINGLAVPKVWAFLQSDAEKPIFDEGDTSKNGGRTKKKCVGSSVRCWLNLSMRSALVFQ